MHTAPQIDGECICVNLLIDKSILLPLSMDVFGYVYSMWLCVRVHLCASTFMQIHTALHIYLHEFKFLYIISSD